MLHNTETLIADLLGSIPTEPNIAAMEKAEQDAAEARRPKWDSEQVDIDELMAKTVGEGEIDFSKLSRGPLTSKETSTEEISRVCADVLRRMNGQTDDFRKVDDSEPDEDDPEQEPEIPADEDVRKNVAYLRGKAGDDVDQAYEIANAELHQNEQRGRALLKAIAYGYAA
ncbi:MAG: hypothetical protein WA197_18450 [Candidatus Acidiferrales bacterium]